MDDANTIIALIESQGKIGEARHTDVCRRLDVIETDNRAVRTALQDGALIHLGMERKLAELKSSDDSSDIRVGALSDKVKKLVASVTELTDDELEEEIAHDKAEKVALEKKTNFWYPAALLFIGGFITSIVEFIIHLFK